MVQRRQQAAGVEQVGIGRSGLQAQGLHLRLQRNAGADGFQRQGPGAGGAADLLDFAALDHADAALALLVFELNQVHGILLVGYRLKETLLGATGPA